MTAARVVFKYTMDQAIARFLMPVGARVIDVRTQNDVPCLWALCTADIETEQREFVAFGTGHRIVDPDLEYVGSAHDVGGMGLVFHIFEKPIR